MYESVVIGGGGESSSSLTKKTKKTKKANEEWVASALADAMTRSSNRFSILTRGEMTIEIPNDPLETDVEGNTCWVEWFDF